MIIAVRVFAFLLIVTGCIWILQGFNVLPGSFMSGDRRWAINGAVALIGGIALAVFTRRMSRKH